MKPHQQKMLDEQTVFSLAVLMMDVHAGTFIKKPHMVANAIMKTSLILNNNPGFSDRFKAVQDQLKAAMKSAEVRADSTPLPTDIALAPPPPDAL